MDKRKRMQRFLSIFLACMMILNVPMSALASDEITAGSIEETAVQEIFSDVEDGAETGRTAGQTFSDGFSDGSEDMGLSVQFTDAQAAAETESQETEVITLNKTELTLLVGASETLTATVNLPVSVSAEENSEAGTTAPVIAWSSSNTDAATVAAGVVTAVKIGKTMITASVSDTSGTKYTATCEVTVEETDIIAEGNNCGKSDSDNVQWKLTKDGTLTISGNGAMRNKGNYSENRPYANYLTQIKTVIVGEGVTAIGDSAFRGCSNLKSYTIAGSVAQIGDWAFSGCTALEEAVVPETVTKMGTSVFRNDAGLKKVQYNSATISDYTFWDCTNLTEIEIGDKVTKIDNAFSGCGLKEIVVPETVISISRWEFQNCVSLEKITLNGNASGQSMFNGCTALKEVIVGENGPALTKSMFEGCTSLERLTIHSENKNNNNIKDNIIYSADGTTLEYCVPGKDGELVISDGITAITAGAFKNCSKITKVTIPEGITVIGSKTFANCTSLETVILPKTITDLASDAFLGCTSLKSVVVDGETTGSNFVIEGGIAYSADYKSIKFVLAATEGNVAIKSGVETIPASAFADCTKITKVTIPSTVTSIEDKAFAGCSELVKIVMPDSVSNLGKHIFDSCTKLQTVTLSEALTEIPAYTFYKCSALQRIVIPEGVKSIGTDAFHDCTSLISVSLPSTLVEFKYYSDSNTDGNQFKNCASLKSIVIPERVKVIPGHLLDECYALETIVIPASIEEIKMNGLSGYYIYQADKYYRAGQAKWFSTKGVDKYVSVDPVKWYYEVTREDGIITGQPTGASYQKNAEAAELEVSVKEAEEDVNYSFNWYSNSYESAEDGTAVANGTTNKLIPDTSKIGTSYYYCIVEKTDEKGKILSIDISDFAKIFVSDNSFSGAGTSENPFKLATAEDLKK